MTNSTSAAFRDWISITNTTVQKLASLQAKAFNQLLLDGADDMQALLSGDSVTRRNLLGTLAARGWNRQLEFAIAANDVVADAIDEFTRIAQTPPDAGAPAVAQAASQPTPGTGPSGDVKLVDDIVPAERQAVRKPSPGAASNVLPMTKPAPPHANPTFELFRDKAGEYRFRFNREDGVCLLRSEGYKARSSASNGIASVLRNAGNDARYVRAETVNGKLMFNLRAGNNQVIATSSVYTSAEEMEADIQLLKSVAAKADILDLTAS